MPASCPPLRTVLWLLLAVGSAAYVTEFRSIPAVGKKAKYPSEYKVMPGSHRPHLVRSPLPHTYTNASTLPKEWDWSNINGTSYVTRTLNQHIPQYCGSCWAHGSLSALADRIKIARKAKGVDVSLAIQFILNCGTMQAGSCHGGNHLQTYEFIVETGYVPYESCLTYAACSSESTEGICQYGDYTCTPINTCRTCSTFKASGGVCNPIERFPNATIAEYGPVAGAADMMAEIYKRGPIACGINAEPILEYKGGVFDDPVAERMVNHIVSVTGWGYDEKMGERYWIVRNSWGEYWGEMGYIRVRMGGNQLGLESMCAWAVPGSWTEMNYPCGEDGTGCDDLLHPHTTP